MKLPSVSDKYAAIILRVIMGVIFVTHGAARFYYNSISDFGEFLNSKGFVVGLFLAWAVTIGEMVFGTMLTIGYKIRYSIIFHTLVVILGIFLVHLANGWFVVGHGSGGVEYSLLILAVLMYLYSSNPE